MFGKPYTITENLLEETNGRLIWTAGHNAYQNKSPFAKVQRKVSWDKSRWVFTISDSIEARENCFAELFFHCHPECDVTMNDNRLTIARGEIEIDLFVEAAMGVQVLQGSHDPMAGWYSPRFNEIRECSTIRIYGSMLGDANILTRICVN